MEFIIFSRSFLDGIVFCSKFLKKTYYVGTTGLFFFYVDPSVTDHKWAFLK